MNYKSLCAVFGENPDELEFGYDEEYYTCSKMKLRLVLAMQKAIADGCDGFITTVDQGAAMWGAEACIAMRESGAATSLVCVPTSETQAARWHPERRERYYAVLEAADEVAEDRGGMSAEEYILDTAACAIVLGDASKERLAALILRAREKGVAVTVV